jgi:hypothetical protein
MGNADGNADGDILIARNADGDILIARRRWGSLGNRIDWLLGSSGP